MLKDILESAKKLLCSPAGVHSRDIEVERLCKLILGHSFPDPEDRGSWEILTVCQREGCYTVFEKMDQEKWDHDEFCDEHHN